MSYLRTGKDGRMELCGGVMRSGHASGHAWACSIRDCTLSLFVDG